MTDAQRIFNFFSGFDTDHAGRTIYDYHRMDHETLESVHDYIQWAFPTRSASQCQAANAPLLSDEAVELINGSQRALGNYYAMFVRMMSFYVDSKHWLVETNHNHLRITRIIESLGEIYGTGIAEYFLKAMLNLNEIHGFPINENSIAFWLRAIDAVVVRNSSKKS